MGISYLVFALTWLLVRAYVCLCVCVANLASLRLAGKGPAIVLYRVSTRMRQENAVAIHALGRVGWWQDALALLSARAEGPTL